MFTVSNTALEAVLRDIRSGVTYPDFWEDRDEADETEEESTETSED